jgi:acyl carrier protein phosphodiesterase
LINGSQSTTLIKSFFRPAFRLYAGAFADVAYDYFLANDSSLFNSQEEIESLTHHTIMDIEAHASCLPLAFIPVFESMKAHNWLSLYGHDWALQKSFEGLARRSRYLENAGPAFEIFNEKRNNMQEAYLTFIPDLLKFNSTLLNELIHKD